MAVKFEKKKNEKSPWLMKGCKLDCGVVKCVSRWSKMCVGKDAMTLPEYCSQINTSRKRHVRKEIVALM